MYLYNYPEYRSRDFYESVIEKVTDRLKTQKGLVAVYQIGGISDPGISDLDIVAVFEDGTANYINPIDELAPNEKYLFVHSVFGIHRSEFIENQRFNLFHNYSLIWGEELLNDSTGVRGDSGKLKKQIAAEYLLSNMIARTVEEQYGMVSVRNILLSAKAIEYDLHFLEVPENNKLFSEIEFVKELRSRWFNEEISESRVSKWFKSFYSSLMSFQTEYYQENQIHLDYQGTGKVSRNIFIQESDKLEMKKQGVSMPNLLLKQHRFFKKLNSFFVKFVFKLPIDKTEDTFLKQRSFFFKKYVESNHDLLPAYATMINPTLYLLYRRQNNKSR